MVHVAKHTQTTEIAKGFNNPQADTAADCCVCPCGSGTSNNTWGGGYHRGRG